MKVFLNPEEALEKIQKKQARLTVVGAGTVGLPLATFFAKNDFQTTAYDLNENHVQAINRGEVTFEYTGILKEVVSRGALKATSDPKTALSDADFIMICVPTPIDQKKHINLAHLKKVGIDCAQWMQPGSVAVLESSVSIGTTRQFKGWVETNKKLKAGKNFGLAYCPERYNPGLPREKHPHIVYDDHDDAHYSLTYDQVGRVLGGYDPVSLKLTEALYSQMLKVSIFKVSSLEAAEATKLLENIFRDINIGLVNELALIYPKLGVDVYEVIRAAQSKPFAFLPHWPGCGVGGECIPVDTWYLIKQAEKIGVNPELLKSARRVNDKMPAFTVSLLESAAKEAKFKLKKSKVLLLGYSYKKNVVDDRVTPAADIKRALEKKGAKVILCDPVIEKLGRSKVPLHPFPQCFEGADAAILVTGHDIFMTADFNAVKKMMRHPVVIDGRNFFDQDKFRAMGYTYKAIGHP